MTEWDATLGIWKGAKASSTESFIVPSPLYIFGYGSLLWRPGDLLQNFPSYSCSAFGYSRVFAQRSCDHRGTPQYPGLVVTLIKNEELTTALSVDESLDKRILNGNCSGLVWEVPEDEKEALIAELDFREKGGYSKQLLKVQLHDRTSCHSAGDIATALVYLGFTDNPLFDLKPHVVSPVQYIPYLKAATIIATAVGPSGPNFEYLFGLVSFLCTRGLHDQYLSDLAASVETLLPCWRKLPRQLCYEPSVNGFQVTRRCVNAAARRIWGCGSNEQLQLGYSSPLTSGDERTSLQLTPAPVELPEVFQACIASSRSLRLVAGGQSSGALLTFDGDTPPRLLLWGGTAPSWVYECAHVDACAESVDRIMDISIVSVSQVVYCSLGHTHMLLLIIDGSVIGLGNDDYGQCTATSSNLPFLLADRSDLFTESATSQCISNRPLLDLPASVRICKVATGLFHSAAISVAGIIYTWGKKEYLVCAEDEGWELNHSSWQCPDGSKVVDLACGCRHTVLLDDLGRVWTFGENRYGCLGRLVGGIPGEPVVVPSASAAFEQRKGRSRDRAPRLVTALEHDIHWRKVDCGWSHTVVSGAAGDGTLVYRAFGRSDLGQYSGSPPPSAMHESSAICSSVCNVAESEAVVDLAAVPSGVAVLNVSCGSECLAAVDALGNVWGCGWDDHGNLGSGKALCKNFEWQLMLLPSNKVSVAEGFLATSGGHTIFYL